MEVANVAGYEELAAFLSGAKTLPYHLFIQVPSRVPTAPGLETASAALGLAEVERILDWDATLSLGELDPSKVLDLSDEHLQKVLAARARGILVSTSTNPSAWAYRQPRPSRWRPSTPHSIFGWMITLG